MCSSRKPCWFWVFPQAAFKASLGTRLESRCFQVKSWTNGEVSVWLRMAGFVQGRNGLCAVVFVIQNEKPKCPDGAFH